jgi:hypothetical protein
MYIYCSNQALNKSCMRVNLSYTRCLHAFADWTHAPGNSDFSAIFSSCRLAYIFSLAPPHVRTLRRFSLVHSIYQTDVTSFDQFLKLFLFGFFLLIGLGLGLGLELWLRFGLGVRVGEG